MEYQLLNAILHGQRLDEPLTWVYIAACVAVGIAGWTNGEAVHYRGWAAALVSRVAQTSSVASNGWLAR